MEHAFLRDWAVVFSVAAATTLVCRMLRQPVVIGYLLAGLIIGPYTPPFTLIHDIQSIHTMAELGLVVLMFVLGLEFNLPKLRKVGKAATLATVLEIFGMLAIGYGIGRALGWSSNDSIYLGAILSISSTTIIIKVLSDLRLNKEAFAQAVFGILILEDIAAVVILTVLSGLGVHTGTEGLTVIKAIGAVGFFVVLFLLVGLAIVPRLLAWVGQFRSREMAGLLAFGLCLTGALLAEHFGFSVALGAFLIGAVIGVCPEVETIEEWIHPIRDLFSALFFVSAGLLINPKLLWDIKGPVLLITAVTVIGKMTTGAVGSFLAGYPPRTASRIGMTLAQIGEFSFVFASLGLKTKMASEFLYPLAVAVSALTTLITPYLIRYSDGFVTFLSRSTPVSLQTRLKHFQQMRERHHEKLTPNAVVSRYLWRLGIYVVLLTAGFLMTAGVSGLAAHHVQSAWILNAIWIGSWILMIPLIHAAAGYINHFLLLTVMDAALRSRASVFFQKIPIQATYGFIEGLIWTTLAILWTSQRLSFGEDRLWFFGVLAIAALAAYLLKTNYVQYAYTHMEEQLDEILGLATSEPLRTAAIALEGADSMLNESIRRVLVAKGSLASQKSIRDLRLREKTGASVIAVYSHGVLNANPSPETVLHAKDILVLLGDAEECKRAQAYLASTTE